MLFVSKLIIFGPAHLTGQDCDLLPNMYVSDSPDDEEVYDWHLVANATAHSLLRRACCSVFLCLFACFLLIFLHFSYPEIWNYVFI